MNLRDLRYLVALADLRHFGRAAEACFVSQPTLSTQIKKLEEELDVTLIERTSRHVMLTDVGRDIADRARAVLREADQIRELAKRTRDPEAGSVRLGLFPTLGPYLLPHVIPRVRKRFPKLTLLLTEDKTEELLRSLRDGRLDAAVMAWPVNDAQLTHVDLFEEEFLLAVPAGHPLGKRKRIDASELSNRELLLLEDGHCLREQALDVCQMAGAIETRGFRATSLETLRAMVAAGVGITLLPALAVAPPVARSELLQLVRFSGQAPHRRIALFWRRSSALSPFLEQLASELAAVPKTALTARIGS
ncbi:MAG: DNA-binding transcriptional regulator OxyR [Rhodanobacteraceae bacterium]|nr:DNA-binding transcriptional regulator OxyR [Rhodanobacteraceae bacterium]MBP9153376.1 DNA-binding transcriptional regulator OxyR [Xanthomonadales bacterium]HQW81206.1 DNA-binding transcriptional regulator OxyR [Pseudomonadota bacterium]